MGGRGSGRGSEASIIVETAVRWAPYGGPDEGLVFELFGMTVTRYRRALAAALDDTASGAVPPATMALVLAYLQSAHRDEQV